VGLGEGAAGGPEEERIQLRGLGSTVLTGIANPLAIALTPDRSLLVGDWASGEIYRISAGSF
jgi:hypothetical protein